VCVSFFITDGKKHHPSQLVKRLLLRRKRGPEREEVSRGQCYERHRAKV
jgi:hypothetical protein